MEETVSILKCLGVGKRLLRVRLVLEVKGYCHVAKESVPVFSKKKCRYINVGD